MNSKPYGRGGRGRRRIRRELEGGREEVWKGGRVGAMGGRERRGSEEEGGRGRERERRSEERREIVEYDTG